ncbi:pentatricopeptide repeat-containing protein At4g33170 [Capsella rubella]|uniref:pentatricopeptide repeat-containing protein At4g33170 n=1 Tax=Capsella rubella TaxID=81985 RepID=UPI000CD5A70F|nr:pentatricopeptide repeat-containing protein At4g33170 [Capsella rubella]
MRARATFKAIPFSFHTSPKVQCLLLFPPPLRLTSAASASPFSSSSQWFGFLRDAISTSDLTLGKCTHARILSSEEIPERFLVNNLISMYSKCGSLTYARRVFDLMPERDLVSWNSVLAAYAQFSESASVENIEEAFLLFRTLRQNVVYTSRMTLAPMLKLCLNSGYVWASESFHGYACKIGLDGDEFVAGALVNIYLKFGQVKQGKVLFEEMPYRDVVLWNLMLKAYLDMGFKEEAIGLSSEFHRSGLHPNEITSRLLARISGDDSEAGQVKSFAHGDDASGVSEIISNNKRLSEYLHAGQYSALLKCFGDMVESDLLLRYGLTPDQYTMTSILKAASSLPEGLSLNKQVHVHAIKINNVADSFVSTALIDAYSRNRCMTEAEVLFERSKFDLVAWNAMMSGYTQSHDGHKTLKLFALMHKQGERSDDFTLATVIKTCGSLFAINQGRQVHAYAIKSGYHLDLWVSSGLLDMYVKCGDMSASQLAFNTIPVPDDVAWTTMISGCIENGEVERAFHVYSQMRFIGVLPDEFTIATLAKASSCLTALEQGRQIHANALKLNCTGDPFVGTSLVDMYAKCGSIDDAYSLFKRIEMRNIAAWNAMLLGLAQHGEGKEVLQLFKQMKSLGINPDKVTFIGVLSACSHSGLVSEAYKHIGSMHRDYGIKPEIEHYSCLADALGRAGFLKEAENLIESMSMEASASMYRTLLAACRVKGDTETGKRVASKLLELDPLDSSAYVLLSNMYAAASKWDEMKLARRMMKGQKVKKDPGISWIEVKKKIHVFVVDDRTNPQTELIYRKVKDVIRDIKQEGYVPETDFTLVDVEEEEKERALYYHSEKLAVAFGLMSTPPSTPIRVIKNLRICGDCHNAMKYIAKVYDREIVLRDANRFHRFKNGICSCGDYW